MRSEGLTPENERYLRGWGYRPRPCGDGWVRPRHLYGRRFYIPDEVAHGPLLGLKQYVACLVSNSPPPE